MNTLMLAYIAIIRLVEMRHARRNERVLLKAGGYEVGASHFWMFFVLHIGWIAGGWYEAHAHPVAVAPWLVVACLVMFVLAQTLRLWSMKALGTYWTTRIVVVPGMNMVTGGPYRWVRHPAYLAVSAELLTLPMAGGAPYTALLATIANVILLAGIRIPVEEAAMEKARYR